MFTVGCTVSDWHRLRREIDPMDVIAGAVQGDERAASNTDGFDVDIDPSAIVSELPLSCQETVDTKAFTGRGEFRALRQICRDVDTVEKSMETLARASKLATSYQMYLMVHRRHSTGYTFLRWRAVGWSTRHLSWQEAEDMAARYDIKRRQWYASVSDAALTLNQRHKDLRKRLRDLEARIKKTRQPIYARPIPMD